MINNKNAIVTGASRGIGASVAEQLALDGYNVVINFNHSQNEAFELKDKIERQKGSCDVFKADIGNYDEAGSLVKFCEKKFGPPTLLVNNAGISKIKLFTDITPQEWDEMMRVDLKGVFNCTQHAVRHMIRNQAGKIINISSVWGMTGASCEVHYSAAKAAIIGFTKALAKELGPSNIQVNCVCPGIVMTDMMSGFQNDELEALKEEIPLGRFGNADDIANTVSFLASEKANYMTGQIISPNGGFLI